MAKWKKIGTSGSLDVHNLYNSHGRKGNWLDIIRFT